MTLRTTLLLALLPLAACGGKEGDDTAATEDTSMTGETGTTETDVDPVHEDNIEALYGAIDVPGQLFLVTAMMAMGSGDCPVVVEAGTVTTISGGCTDDDGNTLSGTVVAEEIGEGGTLTFSNWTIESGGDSVTVDGTATVDDNQALTSNFVVNGTAIEQEFLTPSITYSNFVQTDIMVTVMGSLGDNSNSGTMVAEGIDSFEVSGTQSEAEACDTVPDRAEIDLTGAVHSISYSLNPDNDCDPCVTWTHDGMTGEFCP